MSNVKETVMQFGEGGFLRGFVDYFFHKLREKGLYDGKIVVVQPIEKGMCQVLGQFAQQATIRFLTKPRHVCLPEA